MTSTPPAGLTPAETYLHEAAVDHLAATSPTDVHHSRRDAETILAVLGELSAFRNAAAGTPAPADDTLPSWSDAAAAVERRIRRLAFASDELEGGLPAVGNVESAVARELRALLLCLPDLEARIPAAADPAFVRVSWDRVQRLERLAAAARQVAGALRGFTADDLEGRYVPLKRPAEVLLDAVDETAGA